MLHIPVPIKLAQYTKHHSTVQVSARIRCGTRCLRAKVSGNEASCVKETFSVKQFLPHTVSLYSDSHAGDDEGGAGAAGEFLRERRCRVTFAAKTLFARLSDVPCGDGTLWRWPVLPPVQDQDAARPQ